MFVKILLMFGNRGVLLLHVNFSFFFLLGWFSFFSFSFCLLKKLETNLFEKNSISCRCRVTGPNPPSSTVDHPYPLYLKKSCFCVIVKEGLILSSRTEKNIGNNNFLLQMKCVFWVYIVSLIITSSVVIYYFHWRVGVYASA